MFKSQSPKWIRMVNEPMYELGSPFKTENAHFTKGLVWDTKENSTVYKSSQIRVKTSTYHSFIFIQFVPPDNQIQRIMIKNEVQFMRSSLNRGLAWGYSILAGSSTIIGWVPLFAQWHGLFAGGPEFQGTLGIPRVLISINWQKASNPAIQPLKFLMQQVLRQQFHLPPNAMG